LRRKIPVPPTVAARGLHPQPGVFSKFPVKFKSIPVFLLASSIQVNSGLLTSKSIFNFYYMYLYFIKYPK
jgi:hypothetical protein